MNTMTVIAFLCAAFWLGSMFGFGFARMRAVPRVGSESLVRLLGQHSNNRRVREVVAAYHPVIVAHRALELELLKLGLDEVRFADAAVLSARAVEQRACHHVHTVLDRQVDEEQSP